MNKYKGSEDFEYQKTPECNDNYTEGLIYIARLFAGSLLFFYLALFFIPRHTNSVNIEQKSVVYTNTMSISNYFINLEKP